MTFKNRGLRGPSLPTDHTASAAAARVRASTSVFRNHERTEFQSRKFSELQLVVHMTMNKVLDDTGEDPYFRQSTSSKKKKKFTDTHQLLHLVLTVS